MTNERYGYMCRTDFSDELGQAAGGTRIYPSEADLRRMMLCVPGCGIVRVEIRVVEIVLKGIDYK